MGLQTRKTLEENGETLAAAVDEAQINAECPCYRTIADVKEDADVIVDFSNAKGTDALLDFALKRKLPLLIATTGQSAADKRRIARAAKNIPVFFCGNLSFGVALFCSLTAKVAEAFPYADVEIVETHNASKADSPSGTALMLARRIIAARGGVGKIRMGKRHCRQLGDVGISSLRMGETAGVHEVLFDTGFQLITLRHEAKGRELFARGALNAARFLIGRPAGLYSVKDLSDARRSAE